MLKIPYAGASGLPFDTAVLLKGIERLVATVKGIRLRTEDSAYKWQFTREFMPELYKSHISGLETNCAFCENLVRSSCHKRCMKCRAGTYIHCSPLLPGIPGSFEPPEGDAGNESVPWYYKATCTSFKRLEPHNYFRNFKKFLSADTVDNYEVLEGLTKGVSSGERPCRICACVDHIIYKECLSRKDFDRSTPCDRISAFMESRYCS